MSSEVSTTTSSSQSSTSPIKVLLLLSSNVNIESAKIVATELNTKYGVSDVLIRSRNVPIDKLLSLASSSSSDDGGSTTKVLFVVYTDPKKESQQGQPCVTTSILQKESMYPVYEVHPVDANDTNEEKLIALNIAKYCSLSSDVVFEKVSQVYVELRQERIVHDAQYQTYSPNYTYNISNSYDSLLQITGNSIEKGFKSIVKHPSEQQLLPKRISGKVRDRFVSTSSTTKYNNNKNANYIALVTTDRQSGFDRQLALVPFKGAVLNLTSAYWFEQTKHIIPNHIITIPHPNVSIVKQCRPFAIEFVVRSYMTGSTSTSIWKNYSDGVRDYCGHILPDGMKKNQKLEKNIVTPTTKEEEHDRPISAKDIVKEGWMTQNDYDICEKAALAVFQLGQDIAKQRGLILVDTKYEFGRDPVTNEILLIDEVHTPDSSRYWIASSYQERISKGMEPENIDKEFLRLWFRDHCDPYKDKVIPDAPKDLVTELSRRYILLYELITGQQFQFPKSKAAGGGERGEGKSGGEGGGAEEEELNIAKAILDHLMKKT